MNIKARTVFGFLLTIIHIYSDQYDNVRAICVNNKGEILDRILRDLIVIDKDYLPKGEGYNGRD